MSELAVPQPPAITLWHDSRCPGCQRAIELLRLLGVQIELVDLEQAPPNAEQIADVVRRSGGRAGDLLRASGAGSQPLGLSAATDEALIEALAAHPELLVHPVGIAGDQARVGRPPERVLELLIPALPDGLSPDDFARQLMQGKLPEP